MNTDSRDSLTRRAFVVGGAASVALPILASTRIAGAAPGGAAAEPTVAAPQAVPDRVVLPPAGKRILLSCKLGMIAREAYGKALSIAERLGLAARAGLDGVDFDEAGAFTPEEARDAVRKSGVFVHNAINHAHWQDRLTSADVDVRARGSANIAHCIRVSHAAGGSGVLIVIGSADDGPTEVIEERARVEIRKLIPLAASLGQHILVENVWNRMQYDHGAPPEQTAERFVKFIDSFQSPWVGMYYDIGNHWKYGQPGDWIRAFGPRCVKLDVKGFSRAKNGFTEITEGDLPWDQVRKALEEIGFSGWATAEVGGGGLERLTQVREQMQKVFGL
jgi:hexulose-6-phosphate isomerase